jgi:Mlc titration factor MtfA (ptsG expression regulator)
MFDLQGGVLDHYGASSPAEFFAVATEAFYDKPHQMAARHPDLFDQFLQYFKVDPRAWQPDPALDVEEAAVAPSYFWY